MIHFNLPDGSLRVLEGNKERMLYIQGDALDTLLDWLELRGNQPGPLFVRIRRGGHNPVGTAHSSGGAVHSAWAGEASGGDALQPTDLRRTLAGDLLDAGEDIAISDIEPP